MPYHLVAGCLDFCSAHLQVGILKSSRCPSSATDGRYITQD